MRRWLVLVVLTVIPVSLWAQSPEGRARAADSITPQALAQHVGVIADDSMRGRATPSPGLDMTAQYVVDQFTRLGLTPGGEDGTWFQHYTIPPDIDFTQSQLVFATDSTKAIAKFSTSARLVKPTRQGAGDCTPVLVAGRQSARTLVQAHLNNRCVLYVPPPTPDTASEQALAFLQKTCLGLIMLETSDSADFARRVQATRQHVYLDWREDWSVEVRPEAVKGLRDVLGAAGVQLSQVQADTAPVLRELQGLRISLDLRFAQIGDTAAAPNVIGILKGRDSTLQGEYVVFLAHMDHAGPVRGQPARTGNGVNDNASGTAGLIELAKAFSQPDARPARSLAFVATSGNASNLRGSETFADRVIAKTFRLGFQSFSQQCGNNIVVERVRTGGVRLSCDFFGESSSSETAVAHAAAAINLDQLGRGGRDSVVVNGMDDAKFESSLSWIAAAHPELHLTLVDGGTAVTPESDQFSFARRGVPSLYFHDRLSPSADTTDSPASLDFEQAARIVRLVFHIGFDIADARRAPAWTLQGRLEFLEHSPDQ